MEKNEQRKKDAKKKKCDMVLKELENEKEFLKELGAEMEKEDDPNEYAWKRRREGWRPKMLSKARQREMCLENIAAYQQYLYVGSDDEPEDDKPVVWGSRRTPKPHIWN